MDIEKKEPPSLADSARRIVNSIAGIAETSIKTAKVAKQLQIELDKKDRIISQQSAEIERLRGELLNAHMGFACLINDLGGESGISFHSMSTVPLDVQIVRSEDLKNEIYVYKLKYPKENPHANT